MAKGRVPTRDELLAFIKESTTPIGKREIARAFGISGDERLDLKNMLRELADEGHLEHRRKKLHRSGQLPSAGNFSRI